MMPTHSLSTYAASAPGAHQRDPILVAAKSLPTACGNIAYTWKAIFGTSGLFSLESHGSEVL